MTIRHTKNVTSLGIKRHTRSAANEIVTATVVAAENNTNIVGADVAVPNDIVYSGSDHIPSGTDQYDANDV